MKTVAVIGGGLGGLAAAGELQRAGCKVILYEATHHLGGKARRMHFGDVVLDTGPTLLTMPHVVRDTFERLGAVALLPPLHELTRQCTYWWPDGKTFEVHRELGHCIHQAQQFGPQEGDALRQFYEEAANIYTAVGEPYLEAPYRGPWDLLLRTTRRGPKAVWTGLQLGTLHQLARRHFRSPHLQQFAGRFATYAGASPFAASAAFALIAHVERAQGVFHPQGGMGALAEALGRAVENTGVQIHTGVAASWRHRGSELLAGPVGDERPVDAVVVNADPLAKRAPRTLSLSGYVALFEANQHLSLPHHGVLFSRDEHTEFKQLFSGEQPTDGTLYFCHPGATDARMIGPNRSGLYVMLNAPAGTDGWEERRFQLRQWALARLRDVFPALSTAQLTLRAELTPHDFSRWGAPGGSLYGFLPHGRLGPFLRPKQRGPRGVFFAGGGTHPGGGVPMVMLSGRYAAQEVLAS